MNPASNRAVQRKFREAMAEFHLSGEVEPMRQALLWMLHECKRDDYVMVAFGAVHINNALECAAGDQLKAVAEGN